VLAKILDDDTIPARLGTKLIRAPIEPAARNGSQQGGIRACEQQRAAFETKLDRLKLRSSFGFRI
jgi:hypothetical protein